MDYEAILVRARAEAGAEFVGAFARDLAYEWGEVYEAIGALARSLTSRGDLPTGASHFVKSVSLTSMLDAHAATRSAQDFALETELTRN